MDKDPESRPNQDATEGAGILLLTGIAGAVLALAAARKIFGSSPTAAKPVSTIKPSQRTSSPIPPNHEKRRRVPASEYRPCKGCGKYCETSWCDLCEAQWKTLQRDYECDDDGGLDIDDIDD